MARAIANPMNATSALAEISDANLRGLHTDAVRGKCAALALVHPDSGPEVHAWYEAAESVAKVYRAEIFRRTLAVVEVVVVP